MIAALGWLLFVVMLAIAVPVAVLTIEIGAAAFCLGGKGSRKSQPATPRGSGIAVLVPAHNEGAGLRPTLADIKRQLRDCDRMIVVADNCTDDTATIAIQAGAEVLERNDPERRGKGYALDWGIRHMVGRPPAVVVVVDADCGLEEAAIWALVEACSRTGRPAQAHYAMVAPQDSEVNFQVAEFAWNIKNWLRPLGLSLLGLPCQLTGSGMAFPWAVIGESDIADDSIVEDLKWGLDLSVKGRSPVFCPSARITSEFPIALAAAATQRLRWEGGHLNMIVALGPKALVKSLARFDVNLLAVALDLMVPPLGLLGLLIFGAALVTVLYSIAANSFGLALLAGLVVLSFSASVVLAWVLCGRQVLPIRAFPLVIPYALRKIGLYLNLLLGGSKQGWVRTDRTAGTSDRRSKG